jgi:hypothetical protein
MNSLARLLRRLWRRRRRWQRLGWNEDPTIGEWYTQQLICYDNNNNS